MDETKNDYFNISIIYFPTISIYPAKKKIILLNILVIEKIFIDFMKKKRKMKKKKRKRIKKKINDL